MWCARSPALRAGLVVVLILTLLPALPAERASATNRVTIDAREIRITLLIDVVGANQRVIDRWSEAISRYWNDGPGGHPFKWCGLDVIIAADFQLVSEDEVPRPGRHTVHAERVRRGQHYIPNVITPDPYAPDILSGTGNWHYYGHRGQYGGEGYDKLIAHEAGHFLGLGDEYIWDPERHDLNGNGKRDPGEPTEPDTDRFPDAWDSIMAWEGGSVLQRHIDELIGHHDIDEELECTLRVDYQHEMTWDIDSEAGRAIGSASVELSIELEEGDHGSLTGIGEAVDHEFEAHFVGTVSTCNAGLAEESIIPQFEVTGFREENSFSLNLPDRVDTEMAIIWQCPGTDDARVPLGALGHKIIQHLDEIDGELEDGRFEQAWTEDVLLDYFVIGGDYASSAPLTLRHDIVVFEEPRPVEPEVVGFARP